MKNIVAVLAATFICVNVSSQNTGSDIWSKLDEKQILLSGKRQIVPRKYLTVQADISNLKKTLYSAPSERNTLINLSACIIELPLPNGTYERFRVLNSPVMAEELAAAYPDIKTFSVRGIDNPYANGKLDWNEFGFHAMVLSPEGDYFIDPYCLGNTKAYISYFTSDFIKDPADRIPEAGLEGEEPEDGAQKKPLPGSYSVVSGKSGAAANCVGANLRTYRLAIACTGEYAVAATGQSAPTVAQTLAKIVTTVNRVDGVYEKELSVRLVLVNTQTMVTFTSASSDPFTGNNNANTLINQSQTVITATIGSANFDVGHTFSTGGGGLAFLGCVCQPANKARGITGSPSPVGDPYDIDYVAHEMGHQFGGAHTFNAGTGSCSGNRNGPTAVEPGSGITVMAYAGICGGTDNLGGNSIPYFHAISYDQIVNNTNSGVASGCAVTLTTGNQAPVVNGTSSQIVPISTPFYLTGSATDPDGDPVTYSWEETDPGAATGSWNSGNKPYFMSYAPVTTSTRFFPKASVAASGNFTGTKGEYLPATAQTLNFRLTARDNKMGGGGVCYSNVSVIVDGFGPFKVTNPSTVGIAWLTGSTQNITWDVNGTDLSPISCDSVRVLISYNSGSNYSVLIGSTPNDGIESINVPLIATPIITCRIKIESKGNVFYDIGDNNFTIYTDPEAGFNEVSWNNALGFSAWPNPANNELNFEIGKLNSNSQTVITMLDMLGREISKTIYANKSSIKETMDVSALVPGVYFIKASNNNNESVYRLLKN